MVMSQYTKVVLIRAFKLLHYVLSIALFSLLWFQQTGNGDTASGFREIWIFPSVYAIILLLLLRVYNAYDLMLGKVFDNLFSQALSQVIAAALLYALITLNALRFTSPLPLIMICIFQFVLDAIWCHLAEQLYGSLYGKHQTVIIYGDKADLSHLDDLLQQMQHFHISGIVQLTEQRIDRVLQKLSGCDAVYILGLKPELRNAIAAHCIRLGIDCFFAPCVGDILLSGSNHLQAFSSPIMRISRADPSPEYRFFKRALDIFLSVIGLIVAAPIMLVTALAIHLFDNGPIFYRQTRLTLDGKQFQIIKFRSMRIDAESDGVARLASANDSRITPIGRFIRACRIDELPQLWNILTGDMSLVGPRPERPEIAEEYQKTLPDFHLRLQVKAGLTGFAQIYGLYNTTPSDKLKMDLLYISKMSLMLDLKLIFATVKILLKKESTSGVKEGNTTAIS